MDRININNYEAYFLDYHEGRLDDEERQMTLAFLKDHPALQEEFDAFVDVVLPVPEIRYPGKSELFRTALSLPGASDWEYQCIAFMEGDLNDDELKEFEEQRLSDPEKAKILAMYLSTRLKPEEEVVFENRADLKKKAVLIPRWVYGAVSAAAIFVLGWIVFTPRAGNIEPGLAADSSRQYIYIDKISHPSKFEKIASNNTGPAIIKRPLEADAQNLPAETWPDDEINARDSRIMAALPPGKPVMVENSSIKDAPASSYFVFRSIPSVEDDEYQTLVAFTGDFLRKQLLNQDPELVKKSRFTLWELADAGLQKISDIFGTGANIEREYDEEGELMAVSFESSLVGFNTPVRKRTAAQLD